MPRKSLASDDRQGHEPGTIERVRPSSGPNERTCQTRGASIRNAWHRGQGGDCPAIDGILEEAEEVAGDVDEEVLDVALIASAQAVEHYEMTRNAR
jgi:Domain of unknown function (DUF892)